MVHAQITPWLPSGGATYYCIVEPRSVATKAPDAAVRTVTQEAAVNRLTTRLNQRRRGPAVCGLVVTGCSSGQIAQTATQESATVNGTSANIKDIALRNVHLQAEQTSDFLQPGDGGSAGSRRGEQLAGHRRLLLSITSEVGEVDLTGGGAIRRRRTAQRARRAGRNPADGWCATGGPGCCECSRGRVGHPCRADHQRADLRLHLHLREAAGRATIAVPVAAGDS